MTQGKLLTDPACAICKDTGWEYVDGGVRPCGPCTARRAARTYEVVGMPEDERQTHLDTIPVLDGKNKYAADNRIALEQAKAFVTGTHRTLYVYGGVGTGKTHIACGILNGLAERKTACRFVRVPRLLQATMSALDDAAQEQLFKVPVLCLDDIGGGQGTDFTRRFLTVLLDERNDRGNRTVFTSNLDLDTLRLHHEEDDRLTSRISAGRVVRISGTHDYRRLRGRKPQQQQ